MQISLRLLLAFNILVPITLFGQVTSTWTGSAGDDDWSTAANWDNGVPGMADEAIIEINATITAATAGTPTISRLLVRGGMNRMINLNIDLNVTGQQINDRALQVNAAMFTLGTGKTMNIQAQNGNEGIYLNNANALFTNNGTIVVTVVDNDGIRINSGGTFDNNATVAVDGGTNDQRTLFINSGILNNFSQFILTGGKQFSRGQVQVDGTFINHRNAVLDTEDGRIRVNGTATFTNEGLFTASIGTPLRTDASAPGVSNAGFYQYGGSARLFADDGTNATGTDLGIDLNDATRANIDAGGACFVDIAEAAYNWFDGATLVGVSDASGMLTFNDGTLSANPTTLTTTIPGVSVTISNPCTMALPIDLLWFRGEKMKSAVKLEWQTASEIDNAYVSVERSTDGLEFKEIDRVSGRGNSREIRAYETMDRQPSAGANYYRLRQVDLDGSESFSKVVLVEFNSSPTNLVYPTVVERGQQISIRIATEGPANYVITDMHGREIKRLRIVAKTQETFLLNTQLLNAGSYLLRSATNAEAPVSRFFVQ